MKKTTNTKQRIESALDALGVKIAEAGCMDRVSAEYDQLSAVLVEPLEKSPEPGLYAVRFRDNWDGEGSVRVLLANLDAAGNWTCEEDCKPLLEYQGDEILEVWPLINEAAQPKPVMAIQALISLVAVARRYLPDYDEHPEIQKADEVIERAARPVQGETE